MRLLQVGVVAAAVMLPVSAAFAQPSVEGHVQTITIHCVGTVPDTCSGVVEVLTGPGSGYATRIFIPEGVGIGYGGARVPVTAIEAGDQVRIDFRASNSGNVATSARILVKPGSSPSAEDRGPGM